MNKYSEIFVQQMIFEKQKIMNTTCIDGEKSANIIE